MRNYYADPTANTASPTWTGNAAGRSAAGRRPSAGPVKTQSRAAAKKNPAAPGTGATEKTRCIAKNGGAPFYSEIFSPGVFCCKGK